MLLQLYNVKTAAIKKPFMVSVDDVPVPELKPGDILIQMRACGICGSDLEKVFGKYGSKSMKLGHEPSGIVIDVGSGSMMFKKGDRVFTHHHVPCYSCHLCKHGSETMCSKYYETNLSPCGLSEQYVVPRWNVDHGGVLKLADSTTFEEAAMVEPLACCIRAWSRCSYLEGDSVAIFGVGPTGMLHVMIAHAKKFSKIFCFDVNNYRLNFAKTFNITESLHATDKEKFQKILDSTDGMGVDLAIVATSNLNALNDALEMVRKGGTVMMFGVPSRGAFVNLDMCKVYSKEITIITSYAASDADTKEALHMIESGIIDVMPLITHTYSISQAQRAFEHAKSGDHAMKIIITS